MNRAQLLRAAIVALSLLAVPTAARADAPGYTAGAHVGVLVPQLSSELDSWALFGVELGYIVPVDIAGMARPLGLQLDVMGTAPGAGGTGTSTQLGEDGANYRYDIRVTMIVLELSASWRFPVAETLGIYVQAGPRLYFVETTVDASSAGQSFGRRTQGDNTVGGVAALGADLALGPGAAFFAVEFGGSDLNTRLAGDTNTGALAVDLGYRFIF